MWEEILLWLYRKRSLHKIFGPHPGFRPAHAKGLELTGRFSPSADAAALSAAKHFHDPSTPLHGPPYTDPNGNPHGFALRFHLGTDDGGQRKHTDVVAHSTPFFPVRTGEEFLQFFQAILQSGPDAAHPTPVEQFLGSHPKALAFVQAPKPFPVSLATTAFFGVNAFKFISVTGVETYLRYRIIPALGIHTLDDAVVKDQSLTYLFDEISKRIQEEGPITFKLIAQIAEEEDVTDDSTVQWPEERQLVTLDAVLPEGENEKEQKYIIFDPIPRVPGVEPSADPLLDMRAAVYLLSGRERRAA
ncbi:Catalase-like domain containing protein [Elaphomyces granulatus]